MVKANNNKQTARVKRDPAPVKAMPVGLDFSEEHLDDTLRILISAAWNVAGLTPRETFDTKAAFALLRICGYEADRPRLDYHTQKKNIPLPEKVGRNLEWTTKHLIAWAKSLESTRNWLPMSPIHSHKLSPVERIRHQQAIAEQQSAYLFFANLEADELIAMMVDCEKRETRQTLAIALSRKLGLLDYTGAEV